MKILREQLRSPGGGALLAVLLCLLILLPAWDWLGNWYQADRIQQERAKAAEQLAARASALASAVDQRIALLRGLYAFTRTEWPDTLFDRPFEVYSAGVFFNSSGVRTLMIAPEGIARYIFPMSDSPSLSGYDILNDPDPAIRSDVQRAIHSRGITLGQPGALRQGGFGLTAWQAVYRDDELWGLVSIAIDMDTVLQDSGLTEEANGLNLALRDSFGHTFFGSQDVWEQDPVVQSIGLSEGMWELAGVPEAGWVAAVEPQADMFRLGSLLIVVLMAALVYLTVNRQGQLAQAVETRTRQIAAAQQELEQRVAERTRELSALLDVSHHIGSTLDVEALLEQILIEIKPVLDYTRAGIFRKAESGELKLASAAGELPPAESDKVILLLDQRHQKQVLETLKPVIEWTWEPEGAGPVKYSWLGIPLVIKGQATGMLAFVHQDPHFYQDSAARLALAFAQQVAVALENAHLYEQARQLAVLEERQRLARELHDSVSQVLYSIGLGTKTARTALQQDPAQLADALDYVNRLAEAGQVEMRALIFELRPESLETEGLVAALERQVAVLRTRHQLSVQANLDPEPDVPLAIKENLYRIAQEALHNIIRHAHATQVSLGLTCQDNRVQLEITDNGTGFDPQATYPGHLGLKSMYERAAQCQGQIQIESNPGKGTTIQLVIPLKQGWRG